jgi:purine-binding chemotaxis protein CheW
MNESKVKNDLFERYLEFNLANEHYMVDLLSVLEVISMPETTPIPNAPHFIKGIMNLRGQIVTIFDLRKKLGIPIEENNSEVAVMILKINDTQMGVIVDSINRVLSAKKDRISESKEITGQINTKFISSIYRDDEKLIFQLNIQKLIGLES